MRVELKDGHIYDFKNMRKITIIDDYKIVINGNFEKSRKYRDVELLITMIDDNNYKKLIRYAKNETKNFEFEGICPLCNSERVWRIKTAKIKTLINDPKQKDIIYDRKEIQYKCDRCRKTIKKEDLLYVNIVVYTK